MFRVQGSAPAKAGRLLRLLLLWLGALPAHPNIREIWLLRRFNLERYRELAMLDRSGAGC
jgi:hypothetical protein